MRIYTIASARKKQGSGRERVTTRPRYNGPNAGVVHRKRQRL